MRRSILNCTEYHEGFEQRLVHALRAKDAFFEHLVLHEIAHIVHDFKISQRDSDKWAFEEMGLAPGP